MKLTFSYKDQNRPTLCVTSTQGVQIEITFNSGDAYCVYLNGNEFEANDDLLNGLFVSFEVRRMEYEVISVSEIVRQAENQFEAIMAEVESEARYDADHIRAESAQSRYL